MGSTGASRGSMYTNRRINRMQQQPWTPPQVQPVNQNNPNVANQAPTPQNTPVGTDAAAAFAQLDDKSMAAVINAAKNAVLPNQLADSNDLTQKVVFQAGINEKPMVLDRNAFNQFVQDNGLQNNILSRSINSNSYTNAMGRQVKLSTSDISDMLKYSRLNYIGGKHGGMAYGAGTYLAQTGKIGGNTGYGGTTLNAVLNPATARIISDTRLTSAASRWAMSHPLSAKALGPFSNRTQSAYALAMGYNVVVDHYGHSNPTPQQISKGDYVVVLDRKALVWLQ